MTGIIIWQNLTYPQRKYKNDMEIMYSNINGRITNIYMDRGFSDIRLHNHYEIIKFADVITKSGAKEPLYIYIQVNDTLVSPYSSDSIYIIRNGQKRGFRAYLDFGK